MLDLSINTEVHDHLRELLKNRDWIGANLAQVQAEHTEKWVCITKESLVASGATPEAVKEQIGNKYPKEEVLILRIPRGEVQRPI
ncbi:MAG: DUF5678 domain-containing protein [Chloroflexota bacterium]|nr:DUF5678 domain-containing protein [Chloroflexota bacterium]